MIKRLLIANRGEIACRIIDTAKKIGIQTIALFSEPDRDTRHVSLADVALALPGATAQESYLNVELILSLAKQHQVDAIHPGYGFLSENTAFAKACTKQGIIFVGPTIEAITLMGSKKDAKEKMDALGVPTIPGFNLQNEDIKQIQKKCDAMGYPILLKAAAGGGGKGMRIVNEAKDLPQALSEAKGEAKASFDDDTLIVEKFLAKPRHIECQVFADSHGNAVHLFERDCSIQRRYQKIIEEAPAIGLSDAVKDKVHNLGTKIAKEINYLGAGTIEYLVENENVYFMEMNTRLQVEHPVTEMITGIDLVEWQIRVAQGEPIPLKQGQIECCGHAIEARLYAENPEDDFKPQTGTISTLDFIEEKNGFRIDHGLCLGNTISPYYDPMIAKVIAYRPNREAAIQSLQHALQNSLVQGVQTNQAYLSTILNHNDFVDASYSTNFIKTNEIDTSLKPQSIIAAALFFFLEQQSSLAFFRLNQARTTTLSLTTSKDSYAPAIIEKQPGQYDIKLQDDTTHHIMHAQLTDGHITFDCDNTRHHFKTTYNTDSKHLTLYGSIAPVIFNMSQDNSEQEESDIGAQHALAPMPATVAAVLVEPDTIVNRGDGIIVLEAMKMQHTLTAPNKGRVKEIFFATGEKVNEGVTLYEMEMEEE